MPVTKLFVEGDLDVELLYPILEGSPIVQQGGSKGSLRPQAMREIEKDKVRRKKSLGEPDSSQVAAGYLRDRDFDFAPPDDLSMPTIDKYKDGIPIGWRWCRHEIENYLLEPSVISNAMKWPLAEIEDVIRDVAREIRYYEAARWTVGSVRRSLPPYYELNTRPEELKKKDFAIPSDVSLQTTNNWASSTINSYRVHFIETTDKIRVNDTFNDMVARFDDAFTDNVESVLIWFAGKDILAAMIVWLKIKNKRIDHPAKFVETLRDWVIANPEKMLELLPEWNALRAMLRA